MGNKAGSDRALVCILTHNGFAEQALHNILDPEPDIEVVSIRELLSQKESPGPVFLIDQGGLSIPAGLCLLYCRQHYPSAKIVVLDKDDSDGAVAEALWMGNDGFVSHNDAALALPDAVRAVRGGRPWFPRAILLKPPRLSQRQAIVAHLAAWRLARKEIANILGISVSTVKLHLTDVIENLAVCDRGDLILRWEARQARKLAAGAIPAGLFFIEFGGRTNGSRPSPRRSQWA